MVLGILADRARGTAIDVLARRAHETMAAMIATIAARQDAPRVALSGGCFQNRLLTERTLTLLRAAGRAVFINRQVPPGDGGLALGQALIARRVLAEE
jgi:hydrogenase maturation protein HypF